MFVPVVLVWQLCAVVLLVLGAYCAAKTLHAR